MEGGGGLIVIFGNQFDTIILVDVNKTSNELQ